MKKERRKEQENKKEKLFNNNKKSRKPYWRMDRGKVLTRNNWKKVLVIMTVYKLLKSNKVSKIKRKSAKKEKRTNHKLNIRMRMF